ncbi:hypothetical protein Dd703_0650 [Musicola paradisiaca Ech703]|uniref:Uncharacterized protein n=1 Tax=Musicola paradisiaca (strain Ech703) TaxID=579405 RepID=C6C9L0_MUSP7|nr:hypothetical protein Dd703_0650 [Musicola paradisiaca Ech703]
MSGKMGVPVACVLTGWVVAVKRDGCCGVHAMARVGAG